MTQRRLTSSEVQFLQEALNSDCITCNIRLREGEYQYSLAKAIASFQLELGFPDVKDIIRRLYGEEETNQIQFVRKIQTILKKMEKSNIVRILPKTKPWDLQRYTLSSFKFQDVDKNVVILATDEQMKQTHDVLYSISVQKGKAAARLVGNRIKIVMFALIVCISYAMSVWVLMQHTINSAIFIIAFSVAVVSSLLLGRAFSGK